MNVHRHYFIAGLLIIIGASIYDNMPAVSVDSPQFCQFSLSSYTGTVNDSGNTDYFTVGLSCPQKEDIYATVVAFVDDEHVASVVVKVPAGNTNSAKVFIKLGTSYSGKKYRLLVQ